MLLLAEPVAGAQSLATSLLTPAGVAAEPEDRQGVSTMAAEMICRGAGELSAREHSDALDRLGVQRSTQVETDHVRLSATMLGEKLDEALPLLADMVVRPTLGDEAFGPSRDLSLQSLEALRDEPQQQVMLTLRARHDPPPFGRSPMGRRDDLLAMTRDDVARFWSGAAVPAGSIIAFAGRFDWDHLRQRVEQAFDPWRGEASPVEPAGDPTRGYEHLEQDTTQVHIGLAFDAPPEPHEHSILQRAAVAVLSGGMSGRLFTQVREKRGLCYAVHAAYRGQRDRGTVWSYAGTTAPRAQETLDVLAAELRAVTRGVDASEFQRAIVGMKSRLVMQGESTAARAAAIANDQHRLGRPRTLDELADRVDAITIERLNAYLAEHPPGAMTVVTLGPAPLSLQTPAAA